MIEVILSNTQGVVSRVFDIEDPETAVFAARTLWDDAVREGTYYTSNSLRTTFLVDGKVVRMYEGRRP